MPGEKQGTEGFLIGNLRRELDTIPIANLNPAITFESGSETVSVQLSGLCAQLKLGISVLYAGTTNKLTAIPATGATMQITPFNQFADSKKTFGRPVFQDPTATTNTNNPEPQQVPFSWEGPFTLHNGAQIDITFLHSAWSGFGKSGRIVVQVAVEYNGNWWDAAAVTYALGRVALTQPDPIVVGTL